MKSNKGPWAGQVSLSGGGGFYRCRAINEQGNAIAQGRCEYQLHETLFWATRCAKKTAKEMNRAKTKKAKKSYNQWTTV